MYQQISPTPVPDVSPDVWMLGTSERSAILATRKGLPYVFGHFMTDQNGPEIVQKYRKAMAQHHPAQKAYTIVAISVICAETTEKANDLAKSQFLWNIRQESFGEDGRIPTIEEAKTYEFPSEDIKKIEQMKRKMIIGDPEEVHAKLMKLHKQSQSDEYMIVTIVHEEASKLKSYELIKEISLRIND